MIPFIGKYMKLAGAVAVLAAVAGAYFYGVHDGKIKERVVWQEAERLRSEAILKGLVASQKELSDRNRVVQTLEEKAALAKTENRRLSDEIESLIDREPAVVEHTIEVPADCPVQHCVLPDIARDYWVHNCATGATGDCAGLSDPGSADCGHDPLLSSDPVATVRSELGCDGQD